LPACLAAGRDLADEIVILDSGSTDDSEAVANWFGARWFVNADWQGDGVQRAGAEAAAGLGPVSAPELVPSSVWWSARQLAQWWAERSVPSLARSLARLLAQWSAPLKAQHWARSWGLAGAAVGLDVGAQAHRHRGRDDLHHAGGPPAGTPKAELPVERERRLVRRAHFKRHSAHAAPQNNPHNWGNHSPNNFPPYW